MFNDQTFSFREGFLIVLMFKINKYLLMAINSLSLIFILLMATEISNSANGMSFKVGFSAVLCLVANLLVSRLQSRETGLLSNPGTIKMHKNLKQMISFDKIILKLIILSFSQLKNFSQLYFLTSFIFFRILSSILFHTTILHKLKVRFIEITLCLLLSSKVQPKSIVPKIFKNFTFFDCKKYYIHITIFSFYYKNMQDQIYRFCSSKGNPETLVMLKDPKVVSKLIYCQDTIGFLWVGGLGNQQIQQPKSQVRNDLWLDIKYFATANQAKEELQKNNQTKYVVILSIELYSQRLELKQYQNVQKLIYFSKSKQLQSFKLKEEEITKLRKIFYNDKQKIFCLLEQQKSFCRVLPNFLFMSTEVGVAQVLFRTLHSMLNQRICSKTNQKINTHFRKLIEEIQKIDPHFNNDLTEAQKDDFFSDLSNNMKQRQNIIEWYTKNSLIYKILNNLLRVHRHPTEIFFVQPYFKLLFSSIYQLYREQSSEKKKLMNHKFTCYRGGKMSVQQFLAIKNNVGKIIQSLGFLSTSLNRHVAEKFLICGGTLLIIHVEEEQLGSSQIGFASIEKYSHFYHEQEILFNPLNSFEIIRAEQIEGKQGPQYKIQLSYRVLKKQKRSKQEGKLRKIGQLQDVEKYKNECQGNALTNQYYSLSEAYLYWKKYQDLINPSSIRPVNLKNQLRQSYGQFHLFFCSLAEGKKQFKIQDFGWLQLFHRIFANKNNMYKRLLSQVNLIFQSHQPSEKNNLVLDYFRKYFAQNKYISFSLSQTEQNSLMQEPEFKFFQHFRFYKLSIVRKQKYVITKSINLDGIDKWIDILEKDIQKWREQIKSISLCNNSIQDLDGRLFQLEWLESIDLSSNQIVNIPSEIKKIKYLCKINLKGNRIRCLPKEVFQLSQMLCLNLSYNELTQMPNEIQNLLQLEQLDFSNNQISKISTSIAKLKCLKILFLENNIIEEFPQDQYSATLQQLNLSGNQLVELPHFLTKQLSLRALNVSNNQILFVPEGIKNLKHLTEVNFSNNLIDFLPKEIFELQNLQIFNFQDNFILSLPQEIANLCNLTELKMGGNLFQKLHIPSFHQLQSICLKNNQLSKLQLQLSDTDLKISQMDLSKNCLQQFPRQVCQILSLLQLNLASNRLQRLPEEIGHLAQLKQLNVSNNMLRDLTSQLFSLRNLEKLQIQYNEIREIPNKIAQLKWLVQLNIQSNQITVLPEKFKKLKRLQYLNLSKNQINLPSLHSTLSKLQKLQHLLLSNIGLTDIKDNIFNMKELIQLDVSNNKLKQLDYRLEKLVNLKILDVSGNFLTFIPKQIKKLNLNSFKADKNLNYQVCMKKRILVNESKQRQKATQLLDSYKDLQQ